MRHGRLDYQRIQDPAEIIPVDEPVFLLRGQDPAAASAVRAWAVIARALGSPEHVCASAERQADEMERWHRTCGGRTKPTAPLARQTGHYHFQRTPAAGPAEVRFVWKPLAAGDPIPNRLDLRYHSPDGFQWGFAGSGPAQLAVSLLAHFLQDDELACRLYQPFKNTVLTEETRDDWTLSCQQLLDWVEAALGLPPSGAPLSIERQAYRDAGERAVYPSDDPEPAAVSGAEVLR